MLWQSQPVEEPGYARCVAGFLAKTGLKKRKSKPYGDSFHFQFASFFRFMAANFSLTQFVTWAKPLYGVSRMACFSFSSTNTRSIFSFRSLYRSAYSGVYRASSVSSSQSFQMCRCTVFTQSLAWVHNALVGLRASCANCLLCSPVTNSPQSGSVTLRVTVLKPAFFRCASFFFAVFFPSAGG